MNSRRNKKLPAGVFCGASEKKRDTGWIHAKKQNARSSGFRDCPPAFIKKANNKTPPGKTFRGVLVIPVFRAPAALLMPYPALTVKLMLPVTSCESEEPPAPSKETIAV